jgi:hypothetical protein
MNEYCVFAEIVTKVRVRTSLSARVSRPAKGVDQVACGVVEPQVENKQAGSALLSLRHNLGMRGTPVGLQLQSVIRILEQPLQDLRVLCPAAGAATSRGLPTV